ncbi:hypothetical protein G3I59_16195 [Amycolatopsis rubida]|uniref:Uncharacterized protein n=1 Tax=Amycolatopsis rubida TaxID=112413 RepID=A0ABX0BWB5_9PSEU|nr:hypothetical protein [Amycolatopsis rubida]MYW92099.1 hypothetical protein [Amycolatopsis rubida]NEC57085.1 hypothetical protein [Amycolatopsis rubida]
MPGLSANVGWPSPPTTRRHRVASLAKPFTRLDLVSPSLPTPRVVSGSVRVAGAARHRSAKKRTPAHSRRPGAIAERRTVGYLSAVPIADASEAIDPPVSPAASRSGTVLCRLAVSAAAPVRPAARRRAAAVCGPAVPPAESVDVPVRAFVS